MGGPDARDAEAVLAADLDYAFAGLAPESFVDLRALACRALDGSCGGLEAAAQRLDVVLPATSMRASRMLEAAVGVARVLVHRVRNEQADESGSAGILPS
jgi:hypothetical protein